MAVEEIIERARGNSEKAIVFVTGVPGAGKTLVGVNVATRRRTFGEARAVYLSGNGPLVAVLQEALTRDELARVGNTERKGAVRQRVKPFIQNVHHFRDEGIRTTNAPYDHVVIFDEAQRAWTQAKTSDFMRRRPELDAASQGATVEEATFHLREAVELFLECADPEEVKQRLRTDVSVTRIEAKHG